MIEIEKLHIEFMTLTYQSDFIYCQNIWLFIPCKKLKQVAERETYSIIYVHTKSGNEQ